MIHNIFATPIYISKAILSTDDKNAIKQLDYQRNNENNGSVAFINYSYYKSVKTLVNYHVKQYIQMLFVEPVKFNISLTWINCHDKNDFAQKHNHSAQEKRPDISGIIMLDGINQSSGNLEFHSQKPLFFDQQLKCNSGINDHSWMWIPEQDQIFLFPSTLDHQVSENLNDQRRFTLAFDVKINK